MIGCTYGYKMFDCTLAEWQAYEKECYRDRRRLDATSRFSYLKFKSINEGIVLIRNIFIPKEHEKLATIEWRLEDKSEKLIKKVFFYNKKDSELYQIATERAWALGGHLDPRVETNVI